MFTPTCKRRRQCEERLSTWYPGYQNAGLLYQSLVGDRIEADSKALDLGCGRSTLANRQLVRAKFSSGIDTRLADLRINQAVKFPVLGEAEAIPFASNSINVVLSQWVIEHLPQPIQAFREVARTLKPE
jgi:ubiquinone/menaquinone biosynthesis C-methylase UbiE